MRWIGQTGLLTGERCERDLTRHAVLDPPHRDPSTKAYPETLSLFLGTPGSHRGIFHFYPQGFGDWAILQWVLM